MTEKERFTVDSDGKYWDKINHRYVNLDYLFRLVEELDTKLDNKQHTINEMVKTIRIYDDAYIDLNKKYKKVVGENEQLKTEKEEIKSKAEKFVELYEKDFGKNYSTPPRSGKTVRIQLWIVRKILDEIGILELYGDVE